MECAVVPVSTGSPESTELHGAEHISKSVSNDSRLNQSSTVSNDCISTAGREDRFGSLLEVAVGRGGCRDELVEFLGRPGRLEELVIHSI